MCSSDLRAYKDAIEYMYNDPQALKIFAEYARLPDHVVARVRTLIPKETMNPDKVVGIEQIIAEALAGKFITAPLTVAQVEAMINIGGQ